MDRAKALVVEDNDEHGTIFCEAVEALGARATRCTSEGEAIALVRREFFHVAIIDLSLVPGSGSDEGGLSVMRELAHLGEGTACVLATAHGDFRKAREAVVLYGAVELLEKGPGLTPSVLKEAAGKALGVGVDRYKARQPRGSEVLRGKELEHVWMHRLQALLDPREGAMTLINLMDKLLEGLTPVLVADVQGGALERAEGTYRKELWSKLVGSGIAVEMTQREIDRDEMAARLAAEGLDIVKGPMRQVNVSGVVFRTKARFEEFAS